MSLKQMKPVRAVSDIMTSSEIPEKGHNEMLANVNPLMHTRVANAASEGHVPEDGGT
jgi:hypothetical protein